MMVWSIYSKECKILESEMADTTCRMRPEEVIVPMAAKEISTALDWGIRIVVFFIGIMNSIGTSCPRGAA